ncbi:MAG: GTPase domain-containing protein [Pirellulales bacterium]|nr:GTPase domain-containing protein [Pirellulales bacterium]
MTKSVIQPLESYRLAQYAVPVSCYLCETENTFDAELCTHCQAPMALAHQAKSQKISPRLIGALGASGAGKTVYLGMLMDMLSRNPKRLRIMARGAFSITLQQTTTHWLSRCRFPDKTASEPDRWNWVHCQVRRPKVRQPMELIMPDMAGEAILEEVDHPHTYRVIHSFLKKCSGVLVLVDAVELMRGRHDHDYFTMKLLSYLAELNVDPKQSWRKRPVAIVFTKADQCDECLDDPNGFAQSHATGLWQQCHERFDNHRFFAASVTGACANYDNPREGRVSVPLRIEPRGIVEPFEWLLEGLGK